MEKRNDSSGNGRYLRGGFSHLGKQELNQLGWTKTRWRQKNKTATTMVILGIIFERFGHNKIQQKLTLWNLLFWLQKPFKCFCTRKYTWEVWINFCFKPGLHTKSFSSIFGWVLIKRSFFKILVASDELVQFLAFSFARLWIELLKEPPLHCLKIYCACIACISNI